MMIRASLRACARPVAATRVVVCSKNPVKIGAVNGAFSKAFPSKKFDFQELSVDSGVPDQPVGDAETIAGARNRMANAAKIEGESGAVIVAVEGGVGTDDQGDLECFAWVVVRSPVTGAEGRARSASFMLPSAISDLVHSGMELGDADDQAYSEKSAYTNSYFSVIQQLPLFAQPGPLKTLIRHCCCLQVFSRINSGQGGGTVGRLTKGLISRELYYEHAALLALSPFMNEELFPDHSMAP